MLAGEFTQSLARYRGGDAAAQAELIALIYADLRRIAHRHVSGNRWIATLETTALVNESYLRLVSPAARHVTTRAHFLNLASRVMRQVICDYARKRLLQRRHKEREAPIHEDNESAELTQADQFVRLDDALDDLARVNQRYAKVIDCRFFAGLTQEETAEALGVGVRTVERDWAEAKSWLAAHIGDAGA